MIKNGYGFNFKKDSRRVITDSRDSKIVILDMENDSYYLKLDVANASVFSVTKDEDDSMKLHKRIGHFNYKTLKHMNTTKLVRDMPPISEVDISEFDIKDTNDTNVLRTRSLIEPEIYMDASKHSEWIDAMKAKLEEEIYVKQPQGFEVVGQDEIFYRPYKALYGHKQTPRAWFAKIDSPYLNHNLRRSSTENPMQHGRSKHINVKCHAIREAEKNS
uniref:Retrovirus-related Pol polyprotein from transposon TNT 1-94 n=1 Tax=Tanacetum cinerariifolium TaxID=118510 RepID=A0A699RWD1_TANCI|nr:retrovirus-related Pol polyprotein from transposon TNT 1-94 [Tanacetum cinerariifolium]